MFLKSFLQAEIYYSLTIIEEGRYSTLALSLTLCKKDSLGKFRGKNGETKNSVRAGHSGGRGKPTSGLYS